MDSKAEMYSKKIYLSYGFYIAALLLSLFIFNIVFLQLGSISDKWELNDDYRMHIYWMQKFEDPSLFKNDLLEEYSEFFQTPGFVALYRAGSKTIGLLETSKIIQLLLIIITAFFSYLIISEIFNKNFYEKIFSFFLLAICPGYYEVLYGGYSRGIGYCITLVSIYLLIKEKYVLIFINLILCALVHPPSFIITSSYLAISFLFKRKNIKKLTIIYFIISLLIGSGFLLLKYEQPDAKFGDLIWYDRTMPEFQNDGRSHVSEIKNIFQTMYNSEIKKSFSTQRSVRNLFRKKIEDCNYIFFGKNIETLDDVCNFFNKNILSPLSVIGILFFLFKNNSTNKIRNTLAMCLACSIILFIITDFVAMKLYFPSRYLRPIVQLLSIIGIVQIFSMVNNFKRMKPNISIMLITFILFLAFHGTGFSRSHALNINVADNSDILEFIKTLPRDSQIAANPVVSDNIPAFTGRKVFFNREHCLPFYKNYYSAIKERANKFFELYYTKDENTLNTIANNYGINYLIISKSDFLEEHLKDKEIFYEPFNSEINKIIENSNGIFAWKKLSHKKIYEDNDFIILKL